MEPEHEETLIIPAGRKELEAELIIPARARGLIVFAHGSGNPHRLPRNARVGAAMRERGFGTLMLDFLTPEEERQAALDTHPRFDVPLLASRLGEVTDWVRGRRAASNLRLGYFAVGSGAAAALIAASRRPRVVLAVVSRGGRPDLAREALERVQTPTLLIVGGDDETVLEVNKDAYERIPSTKQLAIVPGASHSFEEPGALDQVARLADGWFREHLSAPPERASFMRL